MLSEKALDSMRNRKTRNKQNYYTKRNRQIWKKTNAKRREEERIIRKKQKELEQEELEKRQKEAEKRVLEDLDRVDESEQIIKEREKRRNKIEENRMEHIVQLNVKRVLEEYRIELISEKIKKELNCEKMNLVDLIDSPDKSKKSGKSNKSGKSGNRSDNRSGKSKSANNSSNSSNSNSTNKSANNSDKSGKSKSANTPVTSSDTTTTTTTNTKTPQQIIYPKKTIKQQLEIDRRLKELHKQYKDLKYKPDGKTQQQREWEELNKSMAKVSFNKGKTWLDILDDEDFNKIVEKVTKVKVWNAVIDSLDPDDMMKALNSMNSVSRRALNSGNVDDRMQLLGMYLKVCKEDLIV